MLYHASQTASSATARSFALTLPYGVTAQIYVHSPFFAITDSTGKALPATGLSVPVLLSTGAANPATLVYTITGKK